MEKFQDPCYGNASIIIIWIPKCRCKVLYGLLCKHIEEMLQGQHELQNDMH